MTRGISLKTHSFWRKQRPPCYYMRRHSMLYLRDRENRTHFGLMSFHLPWCWMKWHRGLFVTNWANSLHKELVGFERFASLVRISNLLASTYGTEFWAEWLVAEERRRPSHRITMWALFPIDFYFLFRVGFLGLQAFYTKTFYLFCIFFDPKDTVAM